MSKATHCLFEVTSPDLLEQYLGLLSPAEQEHVADGANLTVQKERLLARVLVRTVLARCDHS